MNKHLKSAGTWIKKTAIVAGTTVAVTGAAMADGGSGGTSVISGVSGIASDAALGVGAGIAIGVVLFGARVVWRAVKGMAK